MPDTQSAAIARFLGGFLLAAMVQTGNAHCVECLTPTRELTNHRCRACAASADTASEEVLTQ